MMTSFIEKRVDAINGLACNCSTQARIAASLNIPVISHVSKGSIGRKVVFYFLHNLGPVYKTFFTAELHRVMHLCDIDSVSVNTIPTTYRFDFLFLVMYNR